MTEPNFIAAYIADPSSKKEPLYLLLRRAERSYLPGIWQMVTGKIKAGEPAGVAAKREIREECGLYCSKLFNVDVTMFYEQMKKRIAFSANFCGYADQNAPVILSDKEHDSYKWCSFSEALPLLAFPAQQETLSFIHKHFVLQTPDPVNLIK